MELNLIYQNKINGLILPNCQPNSVFEFSKKWLIENNSNDNGLLTKELFSKFGNNISVLGNSLGFQSIVNSGYDQQTKITINRISLEEILNNEHKFKHRKLLFVIEPFGHIDYFKHELIKLDKSVFEVLKKINATIVINYSHEGHLEDHFIEEILKNIVYKKIIFLYNDYLNNFSKYESKNVSFIRFNYYLNRSSRCFQLNLKQNHISDIFNPIEKEFHFLSFNQYPHHHRVKVISELYKNNIADKFLISYNPKFYDLLGSVKYDYENQLKDLGFWDDYLLFTSLPEKNVDFETNFRISGYGYEDIRPYQKSVVSLISDTIFFKRQGFISEKIFKPIMYLQPFLVVGPPYYLREIRNMGFKTFDGFIDERYDEELDDRIRLEKIVKEIIRISNIPIELLLEQLREFEDVLLYNQMKLLSFNHLNTEVDTVKQLITKSYCSEDKKNLL